MRVWEEYGNEPGQRFALMRSGQHARWFDLETHVWVGPEHLNVAPAVAWAMYATDAPNVLKRQEWRML